MLLNRTKNTIFEKLLKLETLFRYKPHLKSICSKHTIIQNNQSVSQNNISKYKTDSHTVKPYVHHTDTTYLVY